MKKLITAGMALVMLIVAMIAILVPMRGAHAVSHIAHVNYGQQQPSHSCDHNKCQPQLEIHRSDDVASTGTSPVTVTIFCPSGFGATGGGFEIASGDLSKPFNVAASRPVSRGSGTSSDGWKVTVVSSTIVHFNAFVVCIRKR
jgi:hypothetical protein